MRLAFILILTMAVAALCQREGFKQAAGDIVWVTTGNSIAKYNADGTAINTNFITEPLPGQGTLAGAYLGGILVSGPIL